MKPQVTPYNQPGPSNGPGWFIRPKRVEVRVATRTKAHALGTGPCWGVRS